jgi:septal ring factor EnvC (AmiA/AmiB activator)
MVLYSCPYCEYESDRLSNLRNHFNKKNKCDEKVFEINPKNCKIQDRKTKLELEPKTDSNELKELKKQLEEKDKQINKLIEKAGDVNNTIIINNYNNPDTSHINNRQVLKALKNINDVYATLFELIYFNPEAPHNHSILYPNMNRNRIMTWDNGEFKSMMIKDFEEEILNNKLDTEIQELVNGLEDSGYQEDNEKRKKLLDKYIKNFNNHWEKRDKNRDNKLMLMRAHDKKDMIKDTKKVLEVD